MEKDGIEVESDQPVNRQLLYAEEMFGSAALVVIGEPTSEEHKNAILERVAHGFASWDSDSTGIDIGSELTALANEAPSGVAGANGEHIVKHGSDTFQLEVIVNPRRETLIEGLRVLLLPPTQHKHIIFAGYTFTGSGDWVVQDGTFSFADLASVFQMSDVDSSVIEQKGCTLTLHCGTPCGQWTEEKIRKSIAGKNLNVSVNPERKLTDLSSIIQFTAYVSYFIKVLPAEELLPASDVVGNIRFTKPTLYIFPAAQGDCAVFGVQGFNMLMDGGFSRRSCFWDFTRHLDRLDVLLISRISEDNLFGMKSFLQRRLLDNIHPEITYAFFNSAPTSDKDCSSSLSISLTEEASLVSSFLRSLGCKPGSVHASTTPVQLYSKIGHGTLDMYVLNPSKDSHDYKDMIKQWNTGDHFTNSKSGVPLNELCSLATMLVWKSHGGEVTRILYPGSAPQSELMKSIEQLKDLDVFKYPNGSKTAPKARKPHAHKSEQHSKAASSSGSTSAAADESVTAAEETVSAAESSAVTPEHAVEQQPVVAEVRPLSPEPQKPETELVVGDIPTEPLLDLPTNEERVTAASPRDAWLDSNEPTPLPEPIMVHNPPAANVEEPVKEQAVTSEEVSSQNREPEPQQEQEEDGHQQEPETSAYQQQTSEMWTPEREQVEQKEAVTLEDIPAPSDYQQQQHEEEQEEEPQTEPEAAEESDVQSSEAHKQHSHQDESQEGLEEEEAAAAQDPEITDEELETSVDTPGLKDEAEEQLKELEASAERSEQNEQHEEADDAAPEDDAKEEEDGREEQADSRDQSEEPEGSYRDEEDNVEDQEAELDQQENSNEEQDGDNQDQSSEVDEQEDAHHDAEDAQEEGDQSHEEVEEDKDEPHEQLEDSIEAAEGGEADEQVDASSAPLMSSSQEEMYRNIAESQNQDLEEEQEEDIREESREQTDQMEYSDSIEGAELPSKSESREDSLEPAAVQSKEQSREESLEPDNNQDFEQQDGHSDLPSPSELPTDPMTQSFIDESTQGQTQSDPMTDSFIDMNTQGSATPVDHDPTTPHEGDLMTRSFIDDPTLCAADRNSLLDTQSEVDKCSNISLATSTPGMTDLDSVMDSSSLNEYQDRSDPQTPADKSDDLMTTSNSDLNPLAPVFKPSNLSQENTIPTATAQSTVPQQGSPVTQTAPVGDLAKRNADLLSGWVADSSCAGCQSDVPHEHTHPPAGHDTQANTDNSTADSQTADQRQSAEAVSEFDPLKDWGQPQHYPHPPSPTPPAEDTQANNDSKPTDKPKPPKANGEKAGSKAKPSSAKSKIGSTPKSAASAAGDAKKPAATTAGAKKPASSRLSAGASKKPSSASSSATAADDAKAKSDKPAATKPASSKLSRPATASKAAPLPASPRPASTTKDKVDSKKSKPAASGEEKEKKTSSSAADKPKSKLSKPDSAKPKTSRPVSATDKKPAAEKKSASSATEVKKTKPVAAKTSKTSSVKTAAASSSATGAAKSAAAYKGSTVYVDLAYVPHHGDKRYVGTEFFQLIHARYYVFSALNLSEESLDALLSAKSSWESDPVTIIPTYDTDVLHNWLTTKRNKLDKLNIDVAPAANRCFVQLAANNSSFPAFRLEF